MSWLLFLDESGHDHRNMPYEVRGGVALHARQLWPFVQGMQRVELDSFGCHLHQFRKELKGSTLLDRKRFRLAGQAGSLEAEVRRKHARAFLTKGLQFPPSIPRNGRTNKRRNRRRIRAMAEPVAISRPGLRARAGVRHVWDPLCREPVRPRQRIKKEVTQLGPPEGHPSAEPPDVLSPGNRP